MVSKAVKAIKASSTRCFHLIKKAVILKYIQTSYYFDLSVDMSLPLSEFLVPPHTYHLAVKL